MVILASSSQTRAALLRRAGIDIRVDPAGLDESAMIAAMRDTDDPLPPEDVAAVLADAKAETVSARNPDTLVAAADQTLALGDRLFQKPADIDQARRQLLDLAGRTHALHSAVSLFRDGQFVWRHVDTAHLTMRGFSPEFLGRYLAAVGDDALSSVGGYQLEGRGAQLFDRIDGDYFTILGLPLLPLLAVLREEGEIDA